MNQPFKTILRKKRTALGITQRAMAAWLNITERAYQTYESGEVVPESVTQSRYLQIINRPYPVNPSVAKLQQEIQVLQSLLTQKRAELKRLQKPPRP